MLYQVVCEQLETFLARREERGHPVPRFIERETRAFLECGILARGFVRVRRLTASKAKPQVLVGACRKLLRLLVAVVQDGKPQEPGRSAMRFGEAA